MEGGESLKVYKHFLDDFRKVRHQFFEQRRAKFGISPPQTPILNNSDQSQNNSEKNNKHTITNTFSSSDKWEFSINIEELPTDIIDDTDLSECYNSDTFTFSSDSEVSSIESSPSPPPTTPAYSPTDPPYSPTSPPVGSRSCSRSPSRSTTRAPPVKRSYSGSCSPSPSKRFRSFRENRDFDDISYDSDDDVPLHLYIDSDPEKVSAVKYR